MKKTMTIALGLLMAGTISVQAQTKIGTRTISQVYKECGIGAAIFNNNGTAAAISNIIWDLGSTASSSALSSPENCEGKRVKVAMLVGSSFDKLEVELAKGEGKYLDTLSALSGKSKETLRNEFKKVIASKDYEKLSKEEKANKLFNIAS